MLFNYKLYITALLIAFSNYTYAVGSCNSLSDAVVTEKYLIEGYKSKIIQTLIKNNTSDTCSFMTQCVTPSRNYENCYGLLNGFLAYATNKMKSESEEWFYLMYLVLKGPHTDGETTQSLRYEFSKILPEGIVFFDDMLNKYPLNFDDLTLIIEGDFLLGNEYICRRNTKIMKKLSETKIFKKYDFLNSLKIIKKRNNC